MWLLCRKFAAAHWPTLATILGLSALAFVTRLIWLEWILRGCWLLANFLPARRRLRLAMWILGTRGRLAGSPRPPGRPQRDWLLGVVHGDDDLTPVAARVCDFADRIIWGGDLPDERCRELTVLVRRLTTSFLRQSAPRTLA